MAAVWQRRGILDIVIELLYIRGAVDFQHWSCSDFAGVSGQMSNAFYFTEEAGLGKYGFMRFALT